MSGRDLRFAAGVGVLLVLGGLGVCLLGNTGDVAQEQDAVVARDGSERDSVDTPDRTDPATEADAPGSPAADTSPRTATQDTGQSTKPVVSDTRIPPGASDPNAASPSDPNSVSSTDPAPPSDPNTGSPSEPDDAGLTEEERQYLKDTREIVESTQAAMRTTSLQVLDAIIDRNTAVLVAQLAPDEGPQPDFVNYLADRYPEITAIRPTHTVNVFSTGSATLYFTYAEVTWRDAGITSQHTIAIPLRYVNGTWRLTSLGEPTDGLTFVQAVQP